MDHIEIALHQLVHDSKVSAKEIAARMGMSHQILLNKANPQNETHKMSLLESVAIQLITGERRIQRAVDMELAKEANKPQSKTLIESVMLAIAEHGDVVRVVHEALEDGRITPREREKCHGEIDEAIEALEGLRTSIANHDESLNLRTVR